MGHELRNKIAIFDAEHKEIGKTEEIDIVKHAVLIRGHSGGQVG